MCTFFYKGFIPDVCMTRIQKSGKYECIFHEFPSHGFWGYIFFDN